jgi:hypothetical protein
MHSHNRGNPNFHVVLIPVILVFFGAVAIGWVFMFASFPIPEQEMNASPQRIYLEQIYLAHLAHEEPGTGHAFGYNIVYTVERHTTLDDREVVVISSSGESHVEIWSPIPDLVALPDGSKFQLSEAESWGKAFKVLKHGT